MSWTDEVKIMGFTRSFRLWELFFPGSQQPPNEIIDFVQPVFETMAPRVGECQFRWETQTVAGAVAGTNSVSFLEPNTGRMFKSVYLLAWSSNPAAGQAIDVQVTPTANAPDKWGRWVAATATLDRQPYDTTIAPKQANQVLELKAPPLVMRGNQLLVNFYNQVGGENLAAWWLHIDCPGEIIPL